MANDVRLVIQYRSISFSFRSRLEKIMSNIAVSAISFLVGIFFVFFGTLKLAPMFSEELYRDMRKIFIKSTPVIPFMNALGPHFIRRVYGVLEVICGVLLAVCPGTIKDVCNVILLLLMAYTLLGVWLLGQGLKEASHSMVFGLLLTCRMIIRLQVKQREQNLRRECEKYIKENLNLGDKELSSEEMDYLLKKME